MLVDAGLDEIQRLGCDVIRVTLSPHELANFDGSLRDTPNLRTLDYLMAQCRQRRIYYYFAFINELGANDNNVAGTLMEHPDGGRKIDYYSWLLDPDFIQRSQVYIGNLLTHKNRYDGIRMIDDPAFCIAELVNEPHTPNVDDPEAFFHQYYIHWLKTKALSDTAENFQLWRKEYTLNISIRCVISSSEWGVRHLSLGRISGRWRYAIMEVMPSGLLRSHRRCLRCVFPLIRLKVRV